MSLEILRTVKEANEAARERDLGLDDDPFEPVYREGIPVNMWRSARAKHVQLLAETGHG